MWTVLPQLHDRIRPVRSPSTEAWCSELVDPRVGTVRLRGRLHQPQDEPAVGTLLVIVHGLGGDTSSPYCRRAASAAARRGWASLRLGLRGSGGDGEDLYHAGLGSDLAHALSHPTLASYDRVLVVGYSLGGHIALHHGLQPAPRVAAIAAVSAPLDLAASQRSIDATRAWVYRRHLLQGLKSDYAAIAKRRPVGTPVEQVLAVRTLRQWDELAIVPRFGFGSVDDYYRSMSIGPQLSRLEAPALYVGMRHDPMVPAWTVDPSLESASNERLTRRWLDDGGHVNAPGSWEERALSWLDQFGRGHGR